MHLKPSPRHWLHAPMLATCVNHSGALGRCPASTWKRPNQQQAFPLSSSLSLGQGDSEPPNITFLGSKNKVCRGRGWRGDRQGPAAGVWSPRAPSGGFRRALSHARPPRQRPWVLQLPTGLRIIYETIRPGGRWGVHCGFKEKQPQVRGRQQGRC